MRAAAKHWLGRHDFSSFRGAGCQSKSPVRSITEFNIEMHNELMVVDVLGDGFLYHMVRNMVGVLLPIGAGMRSVAWAEEVLLARDRKAAGITAPPQGLYLVGVKYPAEMQIPEATGALWFLQQG